MQTINNDLIEKIAQYLPVKERIFTEKDKILLFLVPQSVVSSIEKELSIDTTSLLLHLAHYVKRFSLIPISAFQVGASGLCDNGDILLGVNMEFNRLPMFYSIHGEQFLITLAHSLNRRLIHIGIVASPCGHCRQFMKEIFIKEKELKISFNFETFSLSQLLPFGFGPTDLMGENVPHSLLGNIELKFSFLEKSLESFRLNSDFNAEIDEPLMKAALASCNKSYCIYSGLPSGVAALTKTGIIYSGSYIESVAYNPSISPLHSLAISLWANGENFNEVVKVILVEKEFDLHNKRCISQESILKIFIKDVFVNATMEIIHIE